MKVVASKQVKRLNTQKKNILNVDELNAFKVAYGKPLKTKDYVYYVGMPALVFIGFSFILLYYWWVSLLMGVVGVIYGAKVFLPKSIEKAYNAQSFAQRNKFVNNMTQILTDDGKTVTNALATANARAEGEFQVDIRRLEARLLGADNDQIKSGFKSLAEKYKDDVIFIQYVEQLETAMLEGRANIDTLKDIKSYHNDMKKKQTEYEVKKQGHLKDMKMLCGVVVVFILAVSFSFGFSTYVNDFAHHPTGWIACGIYMVLMLQFFRKFSIYLFDESVLEVKM
ncbi:hypothetical protein QUF84_00565 [Fictibacillus enclensis]|uniref:hypothetical protein n=1 Tax=Fictibacillus enclensis TaxID=1017270 RepID=UPI0025A2DB01|nr:hypothetical protein [Fictibacillus enclensis]MDM5335789.1 hypothetical protein [Fictibacillus enclensis]